MRKLLAIFSISLIYFLKLSISTALVTSVSPGAYPSFPTPTRRRQFQGRNPLIQDHLRVIIFSEKIENERKSSCILPNLKQTTDFENERKLIFFEWAAFCFLLLQIFFCIQLFCFARMWKTCLASFCLPCNHCTLY